MFEIGQQVVCINDTPEFSIEYMAANLKYDNSLDGLTKGCVYTIRDIYTNPQTMSNKEQILLRLVELTRPSVPVDPDPGYLSLRFRPVKKTDITIFTDMLNPVKVTEDA